MSTPAPDAIVVGAGPNGLAAAIEIARTGRSVVVYEARPSIGGGSRSAELTEPGFIHDVCSAVHPLLLASPFFCSLPQRDLGIELVHPELPLAHPLGGTDAAALHRSVEETAAGLGRDGKAYVRLMKPLVDHGQSVVDDILGPLRMPRHPISFGRFGLRALAPAATLGKRLFETDKARGLLAGIAAHSMLPLTKPPTSGVAVLLGLLAHHVGWPVVKGGSQRIADGLAAHLRALGGEIHVDSEVRSLAELPKAKAYLLDVTPRQALAIAGDRFPARYSRRLAKYRYGPGVFKLDWALSGPVPWTAEACRRAGTVHIGPTLEDITRSEADTNEGRHPARPYVLLSQPTICDPTRAPEGKHTLWAYCHTPHGSTKDMTKEIEDQIERFAPGFRDTIIAKRALNAQEMQAYNGNYIGGDINGGVQDLFQHFTRPVARVNPYTTAADDVFFCSSSTPPGGGVHGMCGHFAARAALRRALR